MLYLIPQDHKITNFYLFWHRVKTVFFGKVKHFTFHPSHPPPTPPNRQVREALFTDHGRSLAFQLKEVVTVILQLLLLSATSSGTFSGSAVCCRELLTCAGAFWGIFSLFEPRVYGGSCMVYRLWSPSGQICDLNKYLSSGRWGSLRVDRLKTEIRTFRNKRQLLRSAEYYL